MKISKLYSNIETFKNIAFNLNGLNVIYADVKTILDDQKNSHDLGKTKVADLIDYLLLKKVEKGKHFLFKIRNENGESIFNEYVFYLEILLNDGRFATIRRGVANNTKICLAIQNQTIENFQPPAKWDFENEAIDTAKNIVSDFLNFDFFATKEYDYRKALNYSLRTPPDDYKDVYQLNKFSNGKHINWKPFVFDLLGFDGSLLIKKYENDEERQRIKEFIDKLKTEYSVRVEDRDDIVAQMQQIQGNFDDIEDKIDKFNFHLQDKEEIKRGVEELESSISDLNTNAYNLHYELDQLQKSLANNFAFNIEKVDRVFEETGIFFPDQLKNDYKSLIEFNKKLTNERNKLIANTIKIKRSELEAVNIRLETLNSERESLLGFLQDTDTFRKFKAYQKDLVRIEGVLFGLHERIRHIDSIIKKEKESKDYLDQIQETVDELKTLYQSTEDNERYADIRRKFSTFYKKIMDEDARISWKINEHGNVDFPPPKVHEKAGDQRATAKDEGNTYKKLLCISFDLAILTSYSDESYFRFVYHDDALSQQDPGVKHRLLKLIKELTNKYNLQYILSVIKSDLPLNEEDKLLFFDKGEIVLELNDYGPEGTLFGFEF